MYIKIYIHTYVKIILYEFCFHVLLTVMLCNVAIVSVGGRPGIFLTASKACYALFSESDPHAPAWSSFTSRSPLLSGRKPQLIKTFILFPILFSWCHEGPLAISLTDVSACLRPCVRSCASVCACVCVRVYVKDPRAKYAGRSTVLKHDSRSSRGVGHLSQMACGVSCQGVCRSSPPWDPWQGRMVFVGPGLSGWMLLMFLFCILTPCTPHCPFSIIVVLHVCVRIVSFIGVWVLSGLCPGTSPYRSSDHLQVLERLDIF